MTDRQKPEAAYTRDELRRWKTDMLLKRPATRHTGDRVTGIRLVSVAISPSANGLQMLIVNAHGEEAMMLLNPVLAAALREGILECGQAAGWLDPDGAGVVPR